MDKRIKFENVCAFTKDKDIDCKPLICLMLKKRIDILEESAIQLNRYFDVC